MTQKPRYIISINLDQEGIDLYHQLKSVDGTLKNNFIFLEGVRKLLHERDSKNT